MSFHRNTLDWPWLFFVLVLCVLLGLFSGCSISGKKEKAEIERGSKWVEDMQDRIKDEIEDPDKKNEMLALIVQTEKDLEGLDRVFQKLYADMGTLNDNYNARPEEYQKVFSEFEAGRKKAHNRILDSRFKIRDLSTPEEWKELMEMEGLYRQTIHPPEN